MSDSLLIGIVGKPSSGKSTFLNSVTDAKAKTGAYPFTTIKPNQGITFWRTDCACKKYNCTENCAPKYGKCVDGVRFIPVKIMDVAGLIPGASKGAGLGNKFLDDLRKAHVFMHVIDVSGTTNEKGEECEGYDPSNDIQWLEQEIHDWIFNNLWSRWTTITRAHVAKKRTISETLSAQLGGYGCKRSFIQKLCDNLNLTETSKLSAANTSEFKTSIEAWDEELLHLFVKKFLEHRFPIIYILNKIDLKSSPKNIEKIFNNYDPERIVLTSALSECFLKKMAKSDFIQYKEGDSDFIINEELLANDAKGEKNKQVLLDIRDFVLFRYDTTGVYDAVSKAVQLNDPLKVYPFKEHVKTMLESGKKVFEECYIVKKGTSIREFGNTVYDGEEGEEVKSKFMFAEGFDGRKLAEGEVITEENNVFRVVLSK